MAIGDNLSKRDQGLLGVAVLAIGAAALYWYLAWSPRQAELALLETRVDTLDAANQQAKAQLSRGTVEQMRTEARRYRENLDLMRNLVPAGNEVSALLEQVSTAAKQAGLEINAVEPQPVVEGEEFDTYRYRLKVTGTYHQIGELLARIGSLTRIVAPVDLQLTVGAAAPGQRLTPGAAAIASVIDIQTYVARTAPPAQGKKG